MSGISARLAIACMVPTIIILISFMMLRKKKKKLTDIKKPDEPVSVNESIRETRIQHVEVTLQAQGPEELAPEVEGRRTKSCSSSSSAGADSNDWVKVEKPEDVNAQVSDSGSRSNDSENEMFNTVKDHEAVESEIEETAKLINLSSVSKGEGDCTSLFKHDTLKCTPEHFISEESGHSSVLEQSLSDSLTQSYVDVTDSIFTSSLLVEGAGIGDGDMSGIISLDSSNPTIKEDVTQFDDTDFGSTSVSEEITPSSLGSTCVNVTTTVEENDVDSPNSEVVTDLNSPSCNENAEIDSRDSTYGTPHSNCSDAQSEGSSDSGKGSSDIHTPASSALTFPNLPDCIVFEFELPQNLCGVLIGKKGAHVNMIKETTGAFISVQSHPFDTTLSLCAVIGAPKEVEKALSLVRKKFPLDKYPSITLTQVNAMPTGPATLIPQAAQLHLPEGVMCEVILAGMVSAGHVFLQQPTHPTYPSLSRLDASMLACYASTDTPEMPRPVEGGHICVAPLGDGWYRAQVSTVYPDTEECDVKFVDHGVYSHLPISSLRQIRSDFMSLPFQAEECYLAHIAPMNDDLTWSQEAHASVETLAKGQILEAQIISYAEDGIPLVDLYRIKGSSYVLINRELTERGLARWVEG